MPTLGVIGGSGLYEIPGLELTGERTVMTPYGLPSSAYTIGQLGDTKVAFLPRHGVKHDVAPHRINYRANIRGFHELGVKRIISVYATGGIGTTLRPGDLVVPDQILDMTQGARVGTFYEEGQIVHVDFTDPYCPELRAALLGADLKAIDGGVYACVQGPRLETRQEIKFYSSIGADVVGMTGMPEAILARELEICFGAICVVTNYAAGISSQKLTTQEVITTMGQASERIKGLLRHAIGLVPQARKCACRDALGGSKM